MRSRKLSAAEKTLAQMVAEESGIDDAYRVVEMLAQRGVLHPGRTNASVARALYQRLLCSGQGCMEAMANVAERLGVGFYTVRNYIYYTHK